MELTTKQIGLARHALGLPNRKNLTYRNHFCTGEDSDCYADKARAALEKAECKANLAPPEGQ